MDGNLFPDYKQLENTLCGAGADTVEVYEEKDFILITVTREKGFGRLYKSVPKHVSKIYPGREIVLAGKSRPGCKPSHVYHRPKNEKHLHQCRGNMQDAMYNKALRKLGLVA